MGETAGEVMNREWKKAIKLRENDQRARRLVDLAVACAMQEAGEPDEYNFRRFACDVATLATTCLLQQIYESDAELKAITHERDVLRKMAEDALLLGPLGNGLRSSLANPLAE